MITVSPQPGKYELFLICIRPSKPCAKVTLMFCTLLCCDMMCGTIWLQCEWMYNELLEVWRAKWGRFVFHTVTDFSVTVSDYPCLGSHTIAHCSALPLTWPDLGILTWSRDEPITLSAIPCWKQVSGCISAISIRCQYQPANTTFYLLVWTMSKKI